jgi:hypothetical protein
VIKRAGLVVIVLLAGCTHYHPSMVSSVSLGEKFERPVDVGTGHSSAVYWFGLGPNGDDSLKAAMEDAMLGKKADAMVNILVDRKTYCWPACAFPLYMKTETMLTGTLVDYGTFDAEGSVSINSVVEFLKKQPKGVGVTVTLKNGKSYNGILIEDDPQSKKFYVQTDHGMEAHPFTYVEVKSVKIRDVRGD